MTLADRYSTMIATVFVIMMYGLTMPFLYLVGLLIYTMMFWTDKIIFLRW